MPHPKERTRYLQALLDDKRAERRPAWDEGAVIGSDHPGARPGEPYNEQLFHWFLSIERRRAARSNRPLFLLLVDPKPLCGAPPRVDQAIANMLLVAVRSSLRQTDIVGWYRSERVVGAVLAECRVRASSSVSAAVGQRVADALESRLTPELARQFRVRIHQYTDPQRIDTTGIQELDLTRS
jgi:hypothetical protein